MKLKKINAGELSVSQTLKLHSVQVRPASGPGPARPGPAPAPPPPPRLRPGPGVDPCPRPGPCPCRLPVRAGARARLCPACPCLRRSSPPSPLLASPTPGPSSSPCLRLRLSACPRVCAYAHARTTACVTRARAARYDTRTHAGKDRHGAHRPHRLQLRRRHRPRRRRPHLQQVTRMTRRPGLVLPGDSDRLGPAAAPLRPPPSPTPPPARVTPARPPAHRPAGPADSDGPAVLARRWPETEERRWRWERQTILLGCIRAGPRV